MSLFAALMGDLDDDPFMGGQMRRMNTMMNSFFRDPFSDMMGRSMGTELMPYGGGGRGRELVRDDFGMGFPPMMGMGFPNLRNIFHDMGAAAAAPNCHSYSSSTVMTMTAGPDGRPQVYQASQSVKQGPGGIRETKKTVADSRSGIKKMAIGHHIHDRAHIIEREQNVFSGEHEERQDFINLDEEEADTFNKEWEAKARQMMRQNALEYGSKGGSRRRGAREPQLALPSTHGHNSRKYGRVGSCKAGSPYLALPSSSSYPSGSSEREEVASGEERGRKRRLPEEVVESSDEEEEQLPKQKHLKTTRQEKDQPPSPSHSSSSE